MKTPLIKLFVILSICLLQSCNRNSIVVLSSNQLGLEWDQSKTIDMGLISVGSYMSQKFTLQNKSQNTASNCQAVELSDVTNFSVLSTTCGSTMAPNSSCDVVVEASPQSAGFKDLSLRVKCDLDEAPAAPVTRAKVEAVVTDISWSPTSTRNFGSAAISEYAASTYNYTLSNNGSQSVTGCGAVTLSNPTDFEISSDNCTNPSLSASSTCFVSVRAKPMSSGVRYTSITRTCAESGVVSTQLSKTKVTGVTPVLSVSPLNHNFANVYIGSSVNQNFVFSNGSSIASAKNCSAPVLTNTVDFSLIADSCGSSNLGAGSSCSITVRAQPQSVGLKSTTLSRTCVVGGVVSTTQDQITATGVIPLPALAWSPLTNNYGSIVMLQNSGTTIFTLSNTGPAAATSCSLPSISNTTDFTIVSDTCQINNLASNTGCQIGIRANPSSAGLKRTTLSRTCSFGGTVSTTTDGIEVMGTVPPAPNLSWSPLSNDFGNIAIGSNSSTQVFTLSNSGTAGATGCSAPALGDLVNFEITADTCSTSNLGVSGNCQTTVRARPQSIGVKATTLSRTCSTGGTVSTTTNSITATGIVQTDWREVSGNISFNLVRLGLNSNEFSYMFRNQNDTALTGCSTPIMSDIVNFTITYNGCPAGPLGANTACEVRVRSNPISLGSQSATLSRSCNETGGNVSIALNAIGANAAATTTQVEIGMAASCALQSDGTVKCWGQNGYRTLGDGTNVSKTTPVYVLGINNATQIALGQYHACALLADATIKCWGYGGTGQLGDGGVTTTATTPILVPGISNAVQISAMAQSNFMCATLSNGKVKCWGYGAYGALGDGGSFATSAPVEVSGISTATMVSTGYAHGCALLADSTIKCWGYNAYGQIGDGSTSQRNTPVAVSGITSATSISLGFNHSCALLSDQTLKCWGRNTEGQLGDGTTTQRNTPVAVSGITNANQIEVQNLTSCAVLSDNTARCWGNSNYFDLLGDGTSVSRSTPTLVSGLTNISKISLSSTSACAVLLDSSVYCWGLNSDGNIGSGSITSLTMPQIISGFSNPIQVSGSYSTTCVLELAGTVKCYGSNSNNILGDSTVSSGSTPVVIPGITTATKITVGGGYACVLLADQTIKCWGSNYYGQLGDGTTTLRTAPTLVTGISTAIDVSAGSSHTCAVLSDGTVKCWGQNDYGRIGDSTTSITNKPNPVFATGVTNAIKVVAAYDHTCALLSDGTVKCWGNNIYGKTGVSNWDGVPTTVPGLSSVTKLALGYSHTCALISGGTIKCFGRNIEGQLGSGSVTYASMTPLTVVGMTGATDISINYESSCALLSSGFVKCWGYNIYGQFGDATFANFSHTPVARFDSNNTVSLSSGSPYGFNSCNIKSDQTLSCSGRNESGELGIDTFVKKRVSGL